MGWSICDLHGQASQAKRTRELLVREEGRSRQYVCVEMFMIASRAVSLRSRALDSQGLGVACAPQVSAT